MGVGHVFRGDVCDFMSLEVDRVTSASDNV